MKLSLSPYSFVAQGREELCTYVDKQGTAINDLEGKKRSYCLLFAKALLGTAAVTAAVWALYYENHPTPHNASKELYCIMGALVVMGMAAIAFPVNVHPSIDSIKRSIARAEKREKFYAKQEQETNQLQADLEQLKKDYYAEQLEKQKLSINKKK